MKILQTGLLTLAIAICAQPAMAATVESGSVTTFESGTTLSSSAINGTITALVTAINDNAQRIAALESTPSTSVVGKTYALRQFGMMLRGDNSNSGTVNSTLQSYTLTLASDMTFTLSGKESEAELHPSTGATTLWRDGDPATETGTYSQSGNTITMDFGGDAIDFTVSSDGTVVIFNEFSYGTEEDMPSWTRAESSIIIGVVIDQ